MTEHAFPGDGSTLEKHGRQHGYYITAAELQRKHFPDPKWAVPGIIPEGLTLLAGAPKLGKSWLCLGLSVAVADGTAALGCLPIEPGPVLYCALEDPQRRLKSRLRTVLGDNPFPENLTLVTDLPPGIDAAVDLIDEWLEDHPDARLVIVDVLAKIRGLDTPGAKEYAVDYLVLNKLKKLGDRHRVAVIAVTHLRKMPDDGDVFNEISGSTGLTGAADTSLVLKRDRGSEDGTAHITGRDVNEATLALRFDEDTCTWGLNGDSIDEAKKNAYAIEKASGLDERSQQVIKFVDEHPEGVRAAAVAEHLGISQDQARVYLARMNDSGRIAKAGRGLYRSVSSVTSVTSDPGLEPGRNTRNTNNTPLGADVIPLHGVDVPPATCATCHEPMPHAEPGDTLHPSCEAPPEQQVTPTHIDSPTYLDGDPT